MVDLRVVFRRARVLLMVASLGIPGWAGAAEIQWLPRQGGDGFTVMMPSINIDKLVDEMVSLKTELRRNEKKFAEQVEQKRFTGNDKVLAAIMPGGLLFAAIKKTAYNNAVEKHDQVVADLKELSTDIVKLSSTRGPLAVAKR